MISMTKLRGWRIPLSGKDNSKSRQDTLSSTLRSNSYQKNSVASTPNFLDRWMRVMTRQSVADGRMIKRAKRPVNQNR
jgi:hypothetical protein